MREIVYKIIQHADGWAYQAEGTYSETFPTREAAIDAAKRAAAEQSRPDGEGVDISFEDVSGIWHNEHSDGTDRPEPVVRE